LKQMMEAGITYVADRGYFAYYLLLEVAAAGAFFAMTRQVASSCLGPRIS